MLMFQTSMVVMWSASEPAKLLLIHISPSKHLHIFCSSSSSGQEVDTFRSPGEYLQCKVHAPHQRPGDHLLLWRRHHLLHPHWEESWVQQAVSVHLSLRDGLWGTEADKHTTTSHNPCCHVCFLSNNLELSVFSVWSDYDGTKRPLHVSVVWGGRHRAVVWSPH